MTKPALDALPQAEAQGQAEFAKAWEAATKSGQIQCLKRADAADACLEKFATHFKLYFDPKPTGLPPLAGR